MKVASILDAGSILDMIPSEDLIETAGVIPRLSMSDHVVLIDAQEIACVACDPLGRDKWSVHILSHYVARGRYLWDFSLQAMVWMIKNKNLRYAFFFTEQADRRMKRFLSFFKISPAVVFGDEAVYIVTSAEILQFAAQQQNLLEV